MIKRHIVADDGGFADDNAGAMINHETAPDFRSGVNFDGGDDPAQIREKPRQQVNFSFP